MKKTLILSFLLIAASQLVAQGIVLQGNATFKLGSSTSFYAGPNTTFNGVITNEGRIISFSDLDFVGNRDVGSLEFVGTEDQNLSGDTLDVVDIVVNKDGNSNVVLLTDQVVVSGTLDVENGVIQADDELDLLVQGSSDDVGSGFVEGKLVGLTSGQDVTFPMGLNGFTNYLTLSTSNSGTVVRVECNLPDPDILKPDVDIQEISDEVEWVITSLGGTVEVTPSINFSGVDLQGSTYGEAIAANWYKPVLLVLVPGDSLFRVLASSETEDDIVDLTLGETIPAAGEIRSTDPITISEEPVRLTVALIPLVDRIYFFVPNTFSPNAVFDENRIFRPFFSGDVVTSVSMRVFNNLNDEVYSFALTDSNIDLSLIGWDGRLSSGQTAPGGVYYYDITVISENDSRKKAGSVLLVD